MQSLEELTVHEWNVSTTDGFAEIFVTTDFVSYNGSAVYNDSQDTDITVLLSHASSTLVTRATVSSNRSELITGVTVSCISCVVILMIIIPLIVWRCRSVQQHSISAAAGQREPDRYSTASSLLILLVFTHHRHLCSTSQLLSCIL